MNRRLAVVSAALLAAMASPLPAMAQAKAEGVTIVMPLNSKGPSRDASVKAMREIAAFIRKQPGLLDETLMESKAGRPSHVHVMRWADQKNFEAFVGNVEFQKLHSKYMSVIEIVDSASLYTPVK